MGLIESPLCRRCGAEEETSAHVLCECEATEHSDITIWVPFSWTLRMLAKSNSGGQSVSLLNKQGSHDLDIRLRGMMGQPKRPTCMRTERAQTHLLFYSIPYYTNDVGMR
jgi:hypothetical protein